MNNKMPRTPLSTPLSGSARETEIRMRNIFSGPKKRPPLPFLIPMFAICIFCGNIVSCHMAEPEPPDVSDPASSSQQYPDGAEYDAQLNKIALDYLRAEYNTTVYLAENTPEEPQERDLRLDSVHLIGMDYMGEDLLCLYEVRLSGYSQRMGTLEWQQHRYPTCLVIRLDGNGAPSEALVATQNYREDMPVGDTIRQLVWGLQDLEVSLFRDGFSTPVGPGNWAEPMFLEFEPEVVVHEEWEPVYWPGDYWDEWSIEGVRAVRYYNAEQNGWSLSSMEMTRTDLYTPKDIRVGSTRAEVEEAYPEAIAGDYWGLYPEEDILYYIPWRNPEEADGFYSDLGPALVFLFDGNTVRQINLHNMFN